MKKIIILSHLWLFLLLSAFQAGAQSANDPSGSKPTKSLNDNSKITPIKGDPSGISVESGKPLPIKMKGESTAKQTETVTPVSVPEKSEDIKVVMISPDSKTGMPSKNIDRPKNSTVTTDKKPEGPKPPAPVVLQPKE